jgi:hypothetical protein
MNATIEREPLLGADVTDGTQFGVIDVVVRHESGNQVRVKFDDGRWETYDWGEISWDRGLWHVKGE